MLSNDVCVPTEQPSVESAPLQPEEAKPVQEDSSPQQYVSEPPQQLEEVCADRENAVCEVAHSTQLQSAPPEHLENDMNHITAEEEAQERPIDNEVACAAPVENQFVDQEMSQTVCAPPVESVPTTGLDIDQQHVEEVCTKPVEAAPCESAPQTDVTNVVSEPFVNSEEGVAQAVVDEALQTAAGGCLDSVDGQHRVEADQPRDELLPPGLHWSPVSSPVPTNAVDIHELHLPINVGLVETPKGKVLCKYLDVNRSFYAGVDEREEAYDKGQILCVDDGAKDKIDLEWVHVSTPDIRRRNLIAGCKGADGKPMYVARGMIPTEGPWPFYELSSGWVSEDLDQAHLAFMGVDWKQRDFDVLAWKPRDQ